jgi:uncharacterized protein DUF3147
MWPELLVRGLTGGTIVSLFALLGDVLKPKSFAGLFGAAPSVALASLALTFQSRGSAYVAAEAESMIAGAVALAGYAWLVCRVLRRGRRSARLVSTVALIVWFVIAFGLWTIATGAYRS